MVDRINRYRDLEERGFGSRATVWRKIRKGEFPPPKNILGRPGWTDSYLNKWLDELPIMDKAS